ncbi:MAG TPA: cadherin-like beta sandwich domain-containing protein, partial [Anaeromyxobacteraceae bacterium]
MRSLLTAGCLGVVAALGCSGGTPGSAAPPASDTDATLSALTISPGALTPAFATGTYQYSATVPGALGAVTVTPTARSAHAKSIALAQDGGAALSVTSGAASPPLAVPAPGALSTITVRVTAEDGSTTHTYGITLSRASSATDLCGSTDPVQTTDPGLPGAPTIPAPCSGASLDGAYAIDASTG